MATLDIDLRVRGVSKVNKGLDSAATAATGLEKKLEDTRKRMKELKEEEQSLGGAMVNLRKAFNSGTISESKFRAETEKLTSRIGDTQRNMVSLGHVLRNYNMSLERTTRTSNNLAGATKDLQTHSADFQHGTDASVSSMIRYSHQQRAMLSASNNLSRVLGGMGGDMSSLSNNMGILIRQLATASIGGQGLSNTFKGLVSSLMGPTGLIIAISGATTLLTTYISNKVKASKATKELTSDTKDYAKSLGNVAKASYSSAGAYGAEIAEMNTLLAVTRDVNASVQNRRDALKRLQEMYPAVFNNFDIETIKTRTATEAYNELTKSIIASANARAAEGRIAEKASAQLSLDEQNKVLRERLDLLNRQIESQKELTSDVGRSLGAGGEAAERGRVSKLNNLYKEQQKVQKEISDNLLERAEVQEEINDLADYAVKNQIAVNSELMKTGKEIKNIQKEADGLDTILSRIGRVFQAESDRGNLGGLAGLDKLNQATINRYQKLSESVDRIEKEALKKFRGNQQAQNKITAQAAAERAEIQKALEAELAQNMDSFAQAREAKLNELYQRAGMVRESSRQRDIQADTLFWDKVVANAEKYGLKLTEIEELRKKSRENIDKKWDNKYLQDIEKIQAKIQSVEEKAFKPGMGAEETRKELDKRLKQIEDFYDQILDIMKKNGISSDSLDMLGSFARVTDAANAAADELNRSMRLTIRRSVSSSLNGLTKDLLGSLKPMYDVEEKYAKLRKEASADQLQALNKMHRLEKQINNGLSTMFINLANGFASLGGGILTGAVSEGLSTGDFSQLKNLFKGDNKALGYGAAASFLGSAAMQLSPKTSALGQGLGGLLSGAGTGAMIGSILPGIGTAIGAAVGGLVGLVGGLFGSSSAKKQQELEEMQLEEQKKQTALLERQNALAFTSSIIGQQTNQGIVTGVDRNAFGDIEFVIEGRKLKAVLDRENAALGRGL